MRCTLPVSLHNELKEKLSKNNTCYILITCEQAKSGGPLNVEFSFGGEDPTLASFLLSGAQSYIDEELEDVSLE